MARKSSARRDLGRRHVWQQLRGRWVCTLGQPGTRVKLFQKRIGGNFYREVWVPGAGLNRLSLGTTDRDEAERIGRGLLAMLLTREASIASGVLTLGALWERFRRGAQAFLDNAQNTRRDEEARAAVLLAHFGEACEVAGLTADDVQAYAVVRRAGGIRVVDEHGVERLTKPVRSRTLEWDLKLLKAMVRWAMTVRIDNGARRLLEQNPLDGVKLEREKNPRRPVATLERFEKTRAAIVELRDREKDNADRLRWVLADLALVLVEATGRRVGSVRQLQWPDLDLTSGRIRWRAASDKKRQEWSTPITPKLVDEVKRARALIAELAGLQALRGPVFFAATDPSKPVIRDTLNSWLEKAEAHAKLEPLEGGLWHPYRRKWATERKHHPLKDVATAGGWKDVDTLLTCYMASDDEALLAVMSEERKVREPRAAAGSGGKAED
jgi:integrase